MLEVIFDHGSLLDAVLQIMLKIQTVNFFDIQIYGQIPDRDVFETVPSILYGLFRNSCPENICASVSFLIKLYSSGLAKEETSPFY